MPRGPACEHRLSRQDHQADSDQPLPDPLLIFQLDGAPLPLGVSTLDVRGEFSKGNAILIEQGQIQRLELALTKRYMHGDWPRLIVIADQPKQARPIKR